ncbi:MAG: thioredoxin family protein [Acidimicrobiia bacterium]
MEVTLQYFDDCANWRVALSRLQEVLGKDHEIGLQLVETFEDAERLGFRGSPTVLIDGADPFADASAPIGFACRVYRTEGGMDGAPSIEQLRDALGRDADRGSQ